MEICCQLASDYRNGTPAGSQVDGVDSAISRRETQNDRCELVHDPALVGGGLYHLSMTYQAPNYLPPDPVSPPLDQPWYGIGIGAAFVRVFKKYATFSGRASRGEYWWWYLANSLVSVIPAFILMAGSMSSMFRWIDRIDAGYEPTVSEVIRDVFSFGMGPFGVVLFVLVVVWGLVVLIPNLAVTWRRLHDTGRSGAWYFINLVPFGAIVLLVFLVQQTDPRPNQWDYPPGTFFQNQPPVYGPQGGYHTGQPGYYVPPPGPYGQPGQGQYQPGPYTRPPANPGGQ